MPLAPPAAPPPPPSFPLPRTATLNFSATFFNSPFLCSFCAVSSERVTAPPGPMVSTTTGAGSVGQSGSPGFSPLPDRVLPAPDARRRLLSNAARTRSVTAASDCLALGRLKEESESGFGSEGREDGREDEEAVPEGREAEDEDEDEDRSLTEGRLVRHLPVSGFRRAGSRNLAPLAPSTLACASPCPVNTCP